MTTPLTVCRLFLMIVERERTGDYGSGHVPVHQHLDRSTEKRTEI